MARKPKAPDHSVLFPDFQRRHPHLLLPKLLANKAQQAPFDLFLIQNAEKALAHWADLAESHALDDKEVSLDAEFLRVVFCQALGYKSRADSPDDYQLERQFTVTGAGTADGALGCFAVGKQMRPQAIIECKAIAADLDHDKSSGRTPVQQLWDYLSELPETPWGILTNYRSIRLYHHASPRRAYEEFTIQDFRDPDRVRQFLYLFGPTGLLTRGIQKSLALELVAGSATQQHAVGDDLYKLYSNCREQIIDLLMQRKSYTEDQAIHAAQKLIDRVVFIAFAEDRGLLPHRLIEATYEAVPPLDPRENPRWQNFLNTFRAVDKGHRNLDLPQGYNGKLFEYDPLVDDLQLDDEPWTNFFLSIGKYDFRDEGEVNVEVLGNLFERSISELEKRRTVGLWVGRTLLSDAAAQGRAPAMSKSAERKRFGIYYTPPQFTQFIVEQTLGKLIAERVEPQPTADAQLAALKQLKVLDPACGSGAFLVAAYDRIEDAYSRIIYTMRQESRQEEAAALQNAYPDDILRDNLYGMDLSEQSVEIARLALWLRSARKARRLVDLSANIVQGNSLVSDKTIHDEAQDWRETFPAVFGCSPSPGTPSSPSPGTPSDTLAPVLRGEGRVRGSEGPSPSPSQDTPGFDCVIGNPPWERLKLQEREFFSLSAPDIAAAVNAADRRKLIDQLEKRDATLFKRYSDAKASAEKTLAYVRDSGRFPHTGRGDVNTYMLFAELSRQLVSPDGLVGLLVPSGIATDDTTKHFFNDLMEKKALCALYDFENRKFVFADVDGRFKFSVLLMNGANRQTEAADFVFFAHSLDDLKPADRHITLSARDLKLLNPNTRTCPIFRSRFDCELAKRIYRNVPILIDESRKAGGNPWELQFFRMFDQTNDAELFRTADSLQSDGFHLDGNRWIKRKEIYLPLYEAKMIQAYDHRAASVIVAEGNWMRQGQTDDTTLVMHQNPEFVPMPRFWVSETEVLVRRGEQRREAFLAMKDVTSPTNQRTMIASFIPWAGVVNSAPLMLTTDGLPYRRFCCLLANLNSFAYDFITRQKVGGLHLNFFIVEQLPTFPPDKYNEKCPWDKKHTLEKWISDRVLKLTCTANDMRPLAEAAGFKQGVHKWNEPERALLRAELDAAYFILYGLERDEIDDVLDSFQGVAKEDESHGRPGPTRRAILDAFDSLKSAG